jgi:hypothetical protein
MDLVYGVCHIPPAYVFSFDVAEAQRFYTSNRLKKPDRISIQDFVPKFQCLNGYSDILLCLYDTSKAAKSTKVVGPFHGTEEASHILWMIPRNCQDQYKLGGAMVLQSARELLDALEHIKKVHPIDMVGEGPKSGTKSSNSSKRKMVSFEERILKKYWREKLVCFERNMGVHIPPMTLLTAGNMIPIEPQRSISMGRMSMEPLMNMRDLIKEEVAMCNYPLKLRNLRSPIRK